MGFRILVRKTAAKSILVRKTAANSILVRKTAAKSIWEVLSVV